MHPLLKKILDPPLTNPNDPRFDVFFDSSTLPKLSAHQADSCDGLLTKEECYASLKRFSKGKSPGSDGLTAEIFDCFNNAFEKGEMSISQKRGISSF